MSSIPATRTILTTALPYGGVGVPDDTTLEATGGFGPYGWSWSPAAGSSLPPGLSLDPGGRISGIPAPGSDGTYYVIVHVQDSANPPQFATLPLSIVVQPIVISGTVNWNDAPITAVTSAYPVFQVRDPAFQLVPTLSHYDTTTGVYSIPVPAGTYTFGILFDVAAPFNGERYWPGDYDVWVTPFVVGGTVHQDVEAQQIIHLTSPVDNSQKLASVWVPQPSPVTFMWEGIPQAAGYDLRVDRTLAFPGSWQWEELVDSTTVTGPPVPWTVSLAPSGVDELYQMSIYARNATGTWIGKSGSYIGGYGGYYFTVGPLSITTWGPPDGATVVAYDAMLGATGGLGP